MTSGKRAYFCELLARGLVREEDHPRTQGRSVVKQEDSRVATTWMPKATKKKPIIPKNVAVRAQERSVEPKVLRAKKAKPGEIPRPLEIERVKRRYASLDLETLLLAEGIDGEEVSVFPKRFPLEYFDDEAFETRHLDVWRDLIGKSALPAKVYTDGVWRQGLVVGISDDPRIWKVRVDDVLKDIPRVYISLVGEDPALSAARFARARAARNDAELKLLLEFFIDCAPADDVGRRLDDETCGRILALALNVPKLRDAGPRLSTVRLLRQVQSDFARTNVKLAFLRSPRVAHLLTGPGLDASSGVRLAAASETTTAMVQQQQPTEVLVVKNTSNQIEHLAEAARSFRFHSCLTRPEIWRIILAIKYECLKLQDVRLFSCPSRSVRIDEFADAQRETSSGVATKLGETWPGAVCGHIKNGLKDVHKGWFDLDEKDDEVYACSKLKRFLACVNLVMQDALRDLVHAELLNFRAYVSSAAPPEEATSSKKADDDGSFVMSPSSPKQQQQKTPLFLVDLVVIEGKDPTFGYGTNLESMITIPLECIDKAVRATQHIITAERRVMGHLFWPHDPVLTAIHSTDPAVVAATTDVKAVLEAAVPPLEAYLKTYEAHLDLLRLDVESYVETQGLKMEAVDDDDTAASTTAVGDLVKLATFHGAEAERLSETIPETATLGLVAVACATVRDLLVEKHTTIEKALLELAADKAKAVTRGVGLAFDAVETDLKQKPSNLDEVSDLRALAKGLPDRIAETLHHRVLSAQRAYDILASVRYRVDMRDARLLWDLVAYPAKLITISNDVLDECTKLEQTFQSELDDD